MADLSTDRLQEMVEGRAFANEDEWVTAAAALLRYREAEAGLEPVPQVVMRIATACAADPDNADQHISAALQRERDAATVRVAEAGRRTTPLVEAARRYTEAIDRMDRPGANDAILSIGMASRILFEKQHQKPNTTAAIIGATPEVQELIEEAAAGAKPAGAATTLASAFADLFESARILWGRLQLAHEQHERPEEPDAPWLSSEVLAVSVALGDAVRRARPRLPASAPEVKLVGGQYVAGPPPDGRSVEEHLAELAQGNALPMVCARRCRGSHDIECLRAAARRFAESAGNESEEDASLSVLRDRLNTGDCARPDCLAEEAAHMEAIKALEAERKRNAPQGLKSCGHPVGGACPQGPCWRRENAPHAEEFCSGADAPEDHTRECNEAEDDGCSGECKAQRNASQPEPLLAEVEPKLRAALHTLQVPVADMETRCAQARPHNHDWLSSLRAVLRGLNEIHGRIAIEVRSASDKAALPQPAPEKPAPVAEPVVAKALGFDRPAPADGSGK